MNSAIDTSTLSPLYTHVRLYTEKQIGTGGGFLGALVKLSVESRVPVFQEFNLRWLYVFMLLPSVIKRRVLQFVSDNNVPAPNPREECITWHHDGPSQLTTLHEI